MDRVANSSTSEEQAQQQLESTTGECPFNIYNTEVVRADATQASEIENGDLLRTRRRQPSGMQSADENDDERATASEDQLEDHFALLKADYDLIEHMIPSDSVNNKSFTDVTFIVGPPQHSKKYVGHRVLLAMTSPVFETMFYGDMADKSKYIRIADVAPIGFENLLRYAYTDSLNLSSVEDAMLTAYAAKKYLLPQLLRECLTHIEHNIGPATACVVFEFAHVLNSQQLVLQAMNLIDRQTVNVITNKSFAHVQASTVEFVANRKYLNLGSEFALFDACLAWALAEARRRDLAQDDWPAIRGILGESAILGALRFLAMSQKEFARAVAKTSAGTLQAATSNSSTLAADGSSAGDGGGGELAPQGSQESATGQDGGEMGRQRPAAKLIINPNDPNCLLNDREQRAIFLNLILGEGAAALPPSICQSTQTRQAPPECFTLKRFKSASNLAISTTTTRNIRSIVSKFQCLSENVFIVGLTIPIRLDASSYANRTPKFECHLKFTTRATAASTGGGSSSPLVNESAATTTTTGQQQQHQSSSSPSLGLQTSGQQSGPATLLMDTIDESLHISIARDKDCLVRLKRPILIRMGNINELTLTFQTYALDEDIVALRSPKLRSANFSEQTDGENISWLFFKTSGLEFSELHYYY